MCCSHELINSNSLFPLSELLSCLTQYTVCLILGLLLQSLVKIIASAFLFSFVMLVTMKCKEDWCGMLLSLLNWCLQLANGLRCMQHQAQLMSPSVRHGHKHSTPTVSGKGVSLKITRQLCWLPLSSCWVVSTPDSQSKMYTMDACGINPANASVTKRLDAVQVLCECDNLTGSCRHSGSMMKDLLGLSALETFKDICGLLSMSTNFTLVCACIVIVCAYKMSGS